MQRLWWWEEGGVRKGEVEEEGLHGELVLTNLEAPERGGEELGLELLCVHQDESEVLLCGTVLGLDVLQTVPTQPLLEERHI